MVQGLGLIICLILIGLTTGTANLAAQSDDADKKISIVQRYDLRRTVNGQSKGLSYGYYRAAWFLNPPAANGSVRVEAHYYLTADSAKDLSHVEKPLSDEHTTHFTLLTDGSITRLDPGIVPLVRGFPAPPPHGTVNGQTWVAPGELMVDPNNSGHWTTVPILVQYTLVGNAEWQGQRVLNVQAKYAVRYQKGKDPKGDPNLLKAEGTRDCTIYLDPETRFPVFVREQVGHELWTYADGTKLQNDGFILTFYEGTTALIGPGLASGPGTGPGTATSQPSAKPVATPPTVALNSASPSPNSGPVSSPPPSFSPAASIPPSAAPLPTASPAPTPKPPTIAELRQKTTSDLTNQIDQAKVPKVSVKPDSRGVALTLEDLRFVADSADLLPGETDRLDRLVTLLKTVPTNKTFLILGHSAKAGSEQGQVRLSFDRAMTIVDALKKRGIDPGRLLFDGRGSAVPIASNDTEDGRAKNRRVEIIILD